MPEQNNKQRSKQPPNSAFTETILRWFGEFGRTDLPWQNTKNPYKIWVSETMLQQTQVATVILYFNRFMVSFPTIEQLASAEQDDVLHHWTGLGYYARARNLHKAAKIIVNLHHGEFPKDFDDVLELPGIGRSTAGAILSFSHNKRFPILDGNVKRVLCRYFGVEGWTGKSDIQKKLWALADTHTPELRVAAYTQAIMDFGATQCKRSKPNCESCPLALGCIALQQDKVSCLPSSKPKKNKPTKTAVFALIQNLNNEVLLIKRSPSGIWGGLWCLPELPYQGEEPTNCQIKDWLLSTYQISIKSLNEHLKFKHTFSHYQLNATVVSGFGENSDILSLNDINTFLWFNPDTDLQIGLAAPIKKLLEN